MDGKKRTFDSLRLESGYDIGCADIIAYKENDCLLFVDCDIGALDDKKIQRLSETCKHFRKTLKTYGKFRFVPVLFTIKDCDAQSNSGVRIADRKVIEKMFEELVKGNRDQAIAQISLNYL